MTRQALDAELIFDSSARASRLERYTDAALRQRFLDLIRQFNDFASVEERALPDAFEQFGRLICNRLKLARDWQQHPEILAGDIAQPFFVVGNARSGTTLLQTILTMDDGHRTPRYWEVQHPSPPPGTDSALDAASLEDEEAYVRWILNKSPRLLMAHPYFEQGARTEAEDEYLYALDFHMAYPLPLLKVPSLPQAVPPANPVAAMRFHKQVLQQLQWKLPTRRWVGKGIVHQYILPAVLEVYPDAVCFWIHRPPEQYIPSLLELLEVQYQPFNGELYHVDPKTLVQQLRAGIDHILHSSVIDDPRVHHIRFSDLLSDPAGVIAGIYARHGIAFSDIYRERIVTRMSGSQSRADRYGRFTYSMDKFGLSRGELRSMFAPYYERFGL